MGKSSPKPPDYEAAAVAQGEASRDITEQQTWANRANQYTPWGSTTWDTTPTYDPTTGQTLNQWSQTTNLSPDAQAALDAQMALTRQKSELGGSMYDRMASEYENPMDWGSLQDWGAMPSDGADARQSAEDAIYGRATSRLDPQWDNRQGDMEAKLAAQGLRQGDAAYDRAMEEFSLARNDAYTSAQQEAIARGGSEATRQQNMDLSASNYSNTLRAGQLAEAMQQRGFSLNEINAILQGQQVGMPSMPSYNTATKSETPNILGAAQAGYSGALDQYSAEQAGFNSMMSGLTGLAGLFSDRRLKKNIIRMGDYLGLPLYVWQYAWGAYGFGFMADEVKFKHPDAVTTHESGFDMVDYNMIEGAAHE